MDITLIVIEGPQKWKRFDFSEPDTFLLGRDNVGSTAHFRLNNDDTQVSRNHFLLEINPPDCFIRDAGSLNGTFIVRTGGNQVNLQAGYGNLAVSRSPPRGFLPDGPAAGRGVRWFGLPMLLQGEHPLFLDFIRCSTY
jgi:hypothetical protein